MKVSEGTVTAMGTCEPVYELAGDSLYRVFTWGSSGAEPDSSKGETSRASRRIPDFYYASASGGSAISDVAAHQEIRQNRDSSWAPAIKGSCGLGTNGSALGSCGPYTCC